MSTARPISLRMASSSAVTSRRPRAMAVADRCRSPAADAAVPPDVPVGEQVRCQPISRWCGRYTVLYRDGAGGGRRNGRPVEQTVIARRVAAIRSESRTHPVSILISRCRSAESDLTSIGRRTVEFSEFAVAQIELASAVRRVKTPRGRRLRRWKAPAERVVALPL